MTMIVIEGEYEKKLDKPMVDRVSELKDSLRQSKTDLLKYYTTIVGKVLLPVAIFGAMGYGTQKLTHTALNNQDLATIAGWIFSAGIGSLIGASGKVQDYLNWYRATIDDIKDTHERNMDYRAQLKSLEQQV